MNTGYSILITVALYTLVPTSYGSSPIEETRQIALDGLVQVENLAGSIDITVWDRAEVSITGELGDDVDELEIVESSSGVQIKVHNRQNRRHVDETYLRLKIPVSASVEVESVSADISLQGLQGESVILTSVSGDITAEAQTQRLEAESVSGDVTFRGQSPRSTVETVSGEIDLQGVEGEARVSTVSGDVKFVGTGIDRGRFETVSGDLEMALDLQDGGHLNAESLSGNVEVILPSGQEAEYSAQTYSGRIRSDFGTVKGKSHGAGSSLSHREASNGASIQIASFSGDIRISGS